MKVFSDMTQNSLDRLREYVRNGECQDAMHAVSDVWSDVGYMRAQYDLLPRHESSALNAELYREVRHAIEMTGYTSRCVRPNRAEAQWAPRGAMAGLGNDFENTRDKYNRHQVIARDEHDEIEEVEAEADRHLFEADEYIRAGLCGDAVHQLVLGSMKAGLVEGLQGYAVPVALDEHISATLDFYRKKCARKGK